MSLNSGLLLLAGGVLIIFLLVIAKLSHSNDAKDAVINQYEVQMSVLKQQSDLANKKADQAVKQATAETQQLNDHIKNINSQNVAPDCSSVRAFLLQQAKVLNK